MSRPAADTMRPPDAPAAGSLAGTTRVWLLTAAIAAAALGVYLFPVRDLPAPDAPFLVPVWGIALMYLVAESSVVHLQFRREAYSFSLGEMPLVVGLFFVSPAALVAGQVAGILGALWVVRRQSPVKMLFNLAHFSLETGLALLVFHALVDPADPFGPTGWAAAMVALIVTSIVGSVAIGAAISFSEGNVELRAFTQGLGTGVIITLTNASLALLAVTVLWLEPRAVWLLLVPTATLFAAYRAYSSQREKHESIEFLHESTRLAQQSLDIQSVVLQLTAQSRRMFKADIAEVTFFPEHPGEPGLTTASGPGEAIQAMQPVELDPRRGVWARVAAEEEAVLLPKPIRNAELARHFGERGIRDAIVAPLQGKTGVMGTMMVANRLGDVGTFGEEDLRLFTTLANHAGVALENARLVARLEDSLSRLTEMNRMKDDFVATVSHELRSPLTSIQGYVKTLLRRWGEFDPSEMRSFVETIDRQSDRLRELIEDLLIVSHLESARPAMTVTEVSVPEVVERLVDDLRAHAGGEHRVAVMVDEALPPVRTDEMKVVRILSNLIGNALKYSPSGSTVTVRARSDDGGVVLSVIDEGPGIAPELHDKIFERFYQADQSSTRSVGGTGLGLYICRRLADVIGARVVLEKTSPEGSVFSLHLPPRPPERDRDPDAPAPRRPLRAVV